MNDRIAMRIVEAIKAQTAVTLDFGIADNNAAQIDDADVADNDYAKFTASGLEGRSYAEVLADLSGQAGADFAINTHKITGVVDPVANQDAATKKYVDDNIGGDAVDTAGVPVDNDFAKFTDADTIEGRSYAEVLSDLGIEAGATADQTGAEIKTLYEAEANAFTDAKNTKLAGIEESATADQTGAQIKTLYEAEANAFTDAKNTKLAGIEESATADQTGAEIRTEAEDLNATPSDHSANGPQTDDISAGESVAVANCVYLHSDGEWHKTDADAVATAEGMLGIALEAKNDGQAMNVALAGSFVRDDTWNWTVGGEIYLSCTTGAITQTPPSGTDDIVRIVGYATHADRMFFSPEETIVIHT